MRPTLGIAASAKLHGAGKQSPLPFRQGTGMQFPPEPSAPGALALLPPLSR